MQIKITKHLDKVKSLLQTGDKKHDKISTYREHVQVYRCSSGSLQAKGLVGKTGSVHTSIQVS